jgi:hypothetical protein
MLGLLAITAVEEHWSRGAYQGRISFSLHAVRLTGRFYFSLTRINIGAGSIGAS